MWYAIVLILFVFFGVSMYASRSMKATEGFTTGKTPPDMVALLTKSNNELADTLNVSKYRSNYEDLVIHLEEWANLQMLDLVVKGKLGTVSLDSTAVEHFNSLSDFKTKLNGVIKFLDNK
jgi:hypothetical protein